MCTAAVRVSIRNNDLWAAPLSGTGISGEKPFNSPCAQDTTVQWNSYLENAVLIIINNNNNNIDNKKIFK